MPAPEFLKELIGTQIAATDHPVCDLFELINKETAPEEWKL